MNEYFPYHIVDPQDFEIFFFKDEINFDLSVSDFVGNTFHKYFIYNFICRRYLQEDANLSRHQQRLLRNYNISINDLVEAQDAYHNIDFCEHCDGTRTFTTRYLLDLKSKNTPTKGIRITLYDQFYFYDTPYSSLDFNSLLSIHHSDDSVIRSLPDDLNSECSSEFYDDQDFSDLCSEHDISDHEDLIESECAIVDLDNGVERSSNVDLTFVIDSQDAFLSCQGSCKQFTVFNTPVEPLGKRLRLLAHIIKPNVVIYTPPYSGKSTFVNSLRDKGIIIYDTDDIERWNCYPRTIVTNCHELIKIANISFSLIPTKDEFNKRLNMRGISHDNGSYDRMLEDARKSKFQVYSNKFLLEVLRLQNLVFDIG